MSIQCDIVLQWSATPAQLTALGVLLWNWCMPHGGRLWRLPVPGQRCAGRPDRRQAARARPSPSRTGPPGIHLSVGDRRFVDRQAVIDFLRHELPAVGVERVAVDGTSWRLPDSSDGRCSF